MEIMQFFYTFAVLNLGMSASFLSMTFPTN